MGDFTGLFFQEKGYGAGYQSWGAEGAYVRAWKAPAGDAWNVVVSVTPKQRQSGDAMGRHGWGGSKLNTVTNVFSLDASGSVVSYRAPPESFHVCTHPTATPARRTGSSGRLPAILPLPLPSPSPPTAAPDSAPPAPPHSPWV